MTRRNVPWLGLLVVAMAADILVPAALGIGDPPLGLHHLEHAFLLFGGGVLGIAYVRRSPREWGDPLWLFATILLGAAGLVLMVPELYSRVDAYPVLHTLLHVGFAVVGYFGGYAAERYSPRSGIAWLLMVVMTGALTATGFGAPPPGV